MFFLLFLFGGGGGGGGGALAFMKKTGVWGSILLIIYVLVYYILFFHFLQLWLLSLNVMCCGRQLVLWFHLLALLNLGSGLQGFTWRSAHKVPAWKSEQLLVPCNWWHPLGACWSAYKTKPLQTGVKCSWVFYRIKVAWKMSLFCMRTDDWLNFHVKFQSIHVNTTDSSLFFLPLFFPHKQNLSNSKQMLMCTNTLKKYAFNSFQPEWLLNVMWNIRYMSRGTCVTIQRRSEVEKVFQYYFGICPQHQKLTRINTCSWSMVFVWSWRKNFSFHSRMFQCDNFACRLFYSQVDEPS